MKIFKSINGMFIPLNKETYFFILLLDGILHEKKLYFVQFFQYNLYNLWFEDLSRVCSEDAIAYTTNYLTIPNIVA